jgi:putative addiction module antidote
MIGNRTGQAVGDGMTVLKLKTSVGNSMGVVIPKEMLDRLQIGEGEELFAIETPVYLLTTHDLDVEEELRLGREFMNQYRETFKALAK